jgi:chemotaxis-related protein WspB
MLFLLFQADRDRYAIDADQLVEVLPLIHIKQIPRMPDAVAGAFDYRGTPLPVIDLSQLLLGRPAERRLSTRIMVMRYPDAAGALHLLGLIAERATETFRRNPDDFSPTGVASPEAPYLGPLLSDEHGLVQWIEVRKLLPEAVRDMLFAPAAAAVAE